MDEVSKLQENKQTGGDRRGKRIIREGIQGKNCRARKDSWTGEVGEGSSR